MTPADLFAALVFALFGGLAVAGLACRLFDPTRGGDDEQEDDRGGPG